MKTLRLPAVLESLEPLRGFAVGQAEDAGLTMDRVFKLELALEEILVNIINYAYPSASGEVEVACAMDQDLFRLTIQDWGLPFDPLAKKDPDLTENIEDREIGGLGIFFVREMADEVGYERLGETNLLSIAFALSG
jgi:anti-sigma regulatory factor (Ser/Thr protein kinase)